MAFHNVVPIRREHLAPPVCVAPEVSIGIEKVAQVYKRALQSIIMTMAVTHCWSSESQTDSRARCLQMVVSIGKYYVFALMT